jgi:hypothetical protein
MGCVGDQKVTPGEIKVNVNGFTTGDTGDHRVKLI